MSDLSKAIDQLLAKEEWWANNPAKVRGLPSWNKYINRITRGYQGSRLYTYGARTENGKTAFALQEALSFVDFIADYKATTGEDLGKVIVINPEMNLEQIVERLISNRCPDVDSDEIFTGDASKDERIKWRSTVEGLRAYDEHLILHAGGKYTVTDIEGEINDIKNTGGRVAALIVDYIQLVGGAGRDQREKTMNVSQHLKQICITHDIPVIVMAQLRNPEVTFHRGERYSEENLRPRIFDMAESSDIQKSSDFVAVIYNPESTDNDKEYRNATLYIDKNRGPHAEIGMLFYGRRSEYAETNNFVMSGKYRDK